LRWEGKKKEKKKEKRKKKRESAKFQQFFFPKTKTKKKTKGVSKISAKSQQIFLDVLAQLLWEKITAHFPSPVDSQPSVVCRLQQQQSNWFVYN